MYDLNTITVAGRLTRDPEQGATQSGDPKLTVTIANNIGNHTNYFVCVCYGEDAIKYDGFELEKGDPVSITGMLRIFTPEKSRPTAFVDVHQLWVQKRGPGGSNDGTRADIEPDQDPVAAAWGKRRQSAPDDRDDRNNQKQPAAARSQKKRRHNWEFCADPADRSYVSSENNGWGKINDAANAAFG
jgi:single-stranded DNA-binding protein